MGYSVYKHTFPNGKVYIGITSQKPEYRWANGKGYTNRGRNGEYKQPYMANAIIKYGWDNVVHEILFENLTKDEAEQKEIDLIAYYKSDDREFGYNIEHGGNVISSISEETRKKMGESRKGKPLSEEHKRKIGESLSGKKRQRKKTVSKKEKIGNKNKYCIHCGAEFYPKSNRQKMCEECKVTITREQARLRKQKQRKRDRNTKNEF